MSRCRRMSRHCREVLRGPLPGAGLRSRALALLLSGWTAIVAERAAAACDVPGNAWVAMRLSSDLDRAFRARLLADLEAVLAERGVDVCNESTSDTPPLASLAVSAGSGDLVAVEVVFGGARDERRLERDVDLAQTPRDSRAFTVALVADELLSVAEAASSEAASPAAPSSSSSSELEATSVVDAVAKPAAKKERPWRGGVRAAAEHFFGGQTHLGGDGLLRMSLSPRSSIELALGVRRGLSVDASNGRVRSRSLTTTGGLHHVLVARPFEAGVGLGLNVAWVRLRGDAPRATIDADALSGLACYAQTSSFLSVRLGGSFWFDTSAVLGLPLRAVEATDSGRAATGVSGLQVSLRTGLTIDL
jgi:hypothetical protein